MALHYLTGMKILTALLLFSVSFFTSAQEKMVTANGHKFNVYTKGLESRKKNAPVIVFENGMGMGLGNWDTVIDELAKMAPVFAYYRSGVEKSEKVFQMPTVKVVADNLHALLSVLKIDPPYLLVGHSMGGVYIRGFAGLYPNEVAGLVFIDPADFTESKDDWNSIFRKIGVPEKRIDEMMYDRLYKKSEVDSVRFGPWSEGQVLTELRRTDFAAVTALPLPKVPICFIVGGKFEVPREHWSKDFDHPTFFLVKSNGNMERWRKITDAGAKGSSLIYLPECGHFVHRENPKAVIDAVKGMARSVEF